MKHFRLNFLTKLLTTGVLTFQPFDGHTQSMVTYSGGAGREVFYDARQLSDGKFLLSGYADDLNWISSSIPRKTLSVFNIKNGSGTSKIGFILHLSADLKTILNVIHFPKGAVEDIRYIKSSNIPGQATGDIFISGNTNDTRANNGGYFIGKLNNNFINGVPTDLSWVVPLWAEGYPKQFHPWDVGSDGKVVYIYGQSHGYDWAEAIRINGSGIKEVVPKWRYHKLNSGTEHKGEAVTAPGGLGAISYSSIIFKRAGRCDLRSWNQGDYDLIQLDENGGTKKGKWPLDAFFAGPCDPATGSGPGGAGYTGYSMAATPIYGPSAVAIDKRNNHIYLGMNVKTVLPDGNPDFEPAVIAMDQDGGLKWWSRLYHEIRPDNSKVNSSPDQYVDFLAVDYSQPVSSSALVVLARCHGNNVENFWEGNTIAANPGASGFQNNFTGSNGNIHISWLGKLDLDNGILSNSTYLAEYNEGSNNYGPAHPNPNLDGWPNPNGGWPNVNTTRSRALEVGPDGSVFVIATGRKTITTANAYQKNIKPGQGSSPWTTFVRAYKPDLSVPVYSSILTGQFDPANGSGGGNTELLGVFPLETGVVTIGKHNEDSGNPGTASGNSIPVINVPQWGISAPLGESPILARLDFSAGTPPPDNGTGLSAIYFDNIDFTGTQVSRTDATVNFNWGGGSPAASIGSDSFSARWSGQVKASFSETYSFYTNSDDGIRLWVNGVQLINNWTNHGPTENGGTISLAAGQKYDLVLEYFEDGGGAVAELRWSSPSTSKQIIPQQYLFPAATSARKSTETDDRKTRESITVYPNPAAEILFVDFYTEKEGKATVLLQDAFLQTYKNMEIQAVKGKNHIQINTGNLNSGLFILTFQQGKQRYSRKLLIKK